MEDCGFESIVPRAWTGPVHGVIKGTGYYVDWDGLWFDAAPGVSLESFLKRASSARASTLDLLNRINSTEVGQCGHSFWYPTVSEEY